MEGIWFKNRCPRCNGNLYLEEGIAKCLMCPGKFELDTFKPTKPVNPEAVKVTDDDLLTDILKLLLREE